jgi:hypothetical protein
MKELDILFAIGILIQIIKLSDFILRPHQQVWIQSRFEILTLHLSYLRPLHLYKHIAMKKYIKFFILAIESVVVLIIIMGSMKMIFLEHRTLVFSNYWATILGSLLLMLFTWIGFKIYLGPFCDWLFLHEHFFGFFTRFVIAFLVGYSLSFTSIILIGVMRVESSNPIVGSTIAEALAFSIVTFWETLTALGLIVIILELLLLLVNAAIFIFRYISWRIVEYQKGAWAAIILLITFAIGILDIWIHFKSK